MMILESCLLFLGHPVKFAPRFRHLGILTVMFYIGYVWQLLISRKREFVFA